MPRRVCVPHQIWGPNMWFGVPIVRKRRAVSLVHYLGMVHDMLRAEEGGRGSDYMHGSLVGLEGIPLRHDHELRVTIP